MRLRGTRQRVRLRLCLRLRLRLWLRLCQRLQLCLRLWLRLQLCLQLQLRLCQRLQWRTVAGASVRRGASGQTSAYASVFPSKVDALADIWRFVCEYVYFHLIRQTLWQTFGHLSASASVFSSQTDALADVYRNRQAVSPKT